MKPRILLTLLLALFSALTSCNGVMRKDTSFIDSSHYPLKRILGTWEWVKVGDGKWKNGKTVMTLHDDGTYTKHGFFGDDPGTYKAVGKDIRIYSGDHLNATYTILSLTADYAVLSMHSSVFGAESLRVEMRRSSE